MFYNTTHETGDELKVRRERVDTQEAVIAGLFAAYGGPFTASQIHDLCTRQGKHWPITSIRRALTNLCGRGEVEKGPKVRGPYEVNEYLWLVKETVA